MEKTTVTRPWGHWQVLDEKPGTKVKELVIQPGCSLSDQRHFHRSEHWYVLKGACAIDLEHTHGSKETVFLIEHDTCRILTGTWHRAYNTSTEPCHILEVQYGTRCEEHDIERR